MAALPWFRGVRACCDRADGSVCASRHAMGYFAYPCRNGVRGRHVEEDWRRLAQRRLLADLRARGWPDNADRTGRWSGDLTILATTSGVDRGIRWISELNL